MGRDGSLPVLARPAPSLPTLLTRNWIQAQRQNALDTNAKLLSGAQLMLRLEPWAAGADTQQEPAPAHWVPAVPGGRRPAAALPFSCLCPSGLPKTRSAHWYCCQN